ncbi:hypothetical protein M9Y10_030524 [Tritrichomonas musculus]|uniref:HNH nuclease domain-containing protein n=1 Tax=Tritrichomonas musculus TaxID=1915356 RepID=A0ABR2H4Q1_9EUKA
MLGQPINEESNEVIEFVPLLNHDNYEILNQYPFTIRKRDTHKVINDNTSNFGYIVCFIDNRNLFKHRLIALQFIPNPDNLPQVDHINHDRSDYHLSNLRWVSGSTNQKNKSSNKGVQFEYIDSLPTDAFEIEFYDTKFGRREIKDFYYSAIEDRFYYDNEANYRVLIPHRNPHGCLIVCVRDVDNKPVALVIHRFKEQQGII